MMLAGAGAGAGVARGAGWQNGGVQRETQGGRVRWSRSGVRVRGRSGVRGRAALDDLERQHFDKLR